jgi:hypothetical protein
MEKGLQERLAYIANPSTSTIAALAMIAPTAMLAVIAIGGMVRQLSTDVKQDVD